MKSTKANIGITAILLLAVGSLGGCLNKSESPIVNVTDPNPPANNAPTISGAPATSVVSSNSYAFTPSASDPDGDVLNFSVQNLPSWAQFDTTNGTLSGTPTLAAIGNYANIGIIVSDGNLSNSLPQFSVDVIQNADGSITVSWTPPTQNVDGSALTDLTAYKFYYGTSPGNYSQQVVVNNPGAATYLIQNLAPATYYVAASAINSAGIESGLSNEAIKQVL